MMEPVHLCNCSSQTSCPNSVSSQSKFVAVARMHPKIIIVGGSRGIGLELATQFHALHPQQGAVVATMRRPDPSLLPAEVAVAPLDITNKDSIQTFADSVDTVDTLIINAAVGKADPLLDADDELLRWYLESNVVGVHAVVRALIPALLGSAGPKRLVYISSSDASMTRQIGGKVGLHGPYSITKAAGNMMFIQYYNSLQAQEVMVALIHPGWVATDMGKTAGDGGMPAAKSVAGIVNVVQNKLTFANSPLFVDWQGQAMPW
ncbi:unnamed protein product [Sympodiomycopsis kandeliae]